MRFPIVAIAVTLCTAGAAALFFGYPAVAAPSADPARIVPWHMIGNIGIGMSQTRVEYGYGQGTISHIGGLPYETWAVAGGRLQAGFQNGHVWYVETTSRRYSTTSGLGVGSRIPLGPCHRTARGCEYRWNGFTYEPQDRRWVRLARHDGRLVEAWLEIGRGTVSRVTVLAAPE